MYLPGEFLVEFDPELNPYLHFDCFRACRDDALEDEFGNLISTGPREQVLFNVFDCIDRWRHNGGADVCGEATNDGLKSSRNVGLVVPGKKKVPGCLSYSSPDDSSVPTVVS